MNFRLEIWWPYFSNYLRFELFFFWYSTTLLKAWTHSFSILKSRLKLWHFKDFKPLKPRNFKEKHATLLLSQQRRWKWNRSILGHFEEKCKCQPSYVINGIWLSFNFIENSLLCKHLNLRIERRTWIEKSFHRRYGWRNGRWI